MNEISQEINLLVSEYFGQTTVENIELWENMTDQEMQDNSRSVFVCIEKNNNDFVISLNCDDVKVFKIEVFECFFYFDDRFYDQRMEKIENYFFKLS